ncbi:MAG: YdcF family protein [Kiritimatiellia bacterium]
MIDVLNKIVGFVANPLFVGMAIVAAGLAFVWRKKIRAVAWTLIAGLAWFWFWSMPIVGGWLALPLEEDYPVRLAEEMPVADAIAVMGGGVWGSTNHPYAMLKDGADRAWHAARLWKAGKAPVVIPSNIGAELADVKLLVDLGVPREAVVLENKAVNTEENAKFIRDVLAQRRKNAGGAGTATVLLVTSACHMRRSLYMFRKYAPEIKCIPAATDYQALPWKDESFRFRSLLPSIDAFARNNSFIHEYIGYYGYKWFR